MHCLAVNGLPRVGYNANRLANHSGASKSGKKPKDDLVLGSDKHFTPSSVINSYMNYSYLLRDCRHSQLTSGERNSTKYT